MYLRKNNAFSNFITACPTHKACKIVNGETIHKLSDINPINYQYGYKQVLAIKNYGIKYIFIDEISMISEKIWGVIAQIKTYLVSYLLGLVILSN